MLGFGAHSLARRHAISNELPTELGFIFSGYALEFSNPAWNTGVEKLSNQIEGHVASISETGDLITNISADQIAHVPCDDTVRIAFGGHETLGIFPADHDQPAATMVASVGSGGFLEIEIVGISLSEMLGIKANTPVVITW